MLKDQLKLLREKRNLTKKEIAQAIGITERAYIAYEYGERDISTDTLVKFAQYYGVTTDFLLGVGITTPPDPLDMLNLSPWEKIIIQAYVNISPKKRAELEQIITEIANGADVQLITKNSESEQMPEIQKSRTRCQTTIGEKEDEIAAEKQAKKTAG